MEPFNLKNEKGGYKKAAVLAKINTYTVLMMMLENLPADIEQADHDKLMEEYEKAKQMELPREKNGFFGGSGFSVEDTDNYIATLEAEINRKLF